MSQETGFCQRHRRVIGDCCPLCRIEGPEGLGLGILYGAAEAELQAAQHNGDALLHVVNTRRILLVCKLKLKEEGPGEQEEENAPRSFTISA
jgi:hypothetical protein